LSSPVPSTHLAFKSSERLAQKLGEASNGQYQIEVFPVGVLGTAREGYDLSKDGLADIAAICCSYTPAHFPLSVFVELPLINLTGTEATQLLFEIVDKGLLDSEFADVYLADPIGLTPAPLFSNRKIEKISDFKGMRVIPVNPILSGLWKQLDVQGAILSYPDVYLALSRKTIDAASSSWAASTGWKWQEVAQYPININLYGGYNCPFVVNKKIWQSIPETIQTKWKQVFREEALQTAKMYENEESAAKKLWLAAGRTITELPAAEYAKLGMMAVPIWQDWIEKQEKAGKPAAAVYQTYVEFLRKLGKPVAVRVPGLYKE